MALETLDEAGRRAILGKPAGGYRTSVPTTGFRSNLVNRFAVVPQKRAASKRRARSTVSGGSSAARRTFLGSTPRTIIP